MYVPLKSAWRLTPPEADFQNGRRPFF